MTPAVAVKVQVVALATLAVMTVDPPRAPNALVGEADSVTFVVGAGFTTTMVLAADVFNPATATNVKA
jgi:hypothetical protein